MTEPLLTFVLVSLNTVQIKAVTDLASAVIQGNVDSGKKLSPEELDKLIGLYSKHAFTPSEPEKREQLLKEFGESYDISKLDTEVEDEETKAILKSMAVRKLFRIEDINHINNYVADNVEGFRLKVERGKLGLERI